MKQTMLTSLFVICASAPLFAQDEMPPQQDIWRPLAMIGIAVLFFYFILWRPEQKRRKALEEQRSQLKKGDKVTAMGIIGHVEKENGATVILKMVDGGKIEVLRGAITDVESSVKNEKQDA